MELEELLTKRNECLRLFLDDSRQFMTIVSSCDWTVLDDFERRRDLLLQSINHYDQKIDLLLQQGAPASSLALMRVHEKSALLKEIERSDSLVIQALGQRLDGVKHEIASTRKSKEILSKFRSEPLSKQSGSKLDQEA